MCVLSAITLGFTMSGYLGATEARSALVTLQFPTTKAHANMISSYSTTPMTLLPFVTNLVGKGPILGTPFGMSWQEQTLEVGAVLITANETRVLDIRHLARRDMPALATKKDVRVGGLVNIVPLRPDEFITGVDVRYRPWEGVVGLRILTNKAVSAWFGGIHGYIDSSLRAPSGMFFNSLVGFQDDTVCTRLGALCCPQSMIVRPVETPRGFYERSQRCGAGLFDGDQREFEEVSDEVRAIVVRCDSHVQRVWVLSAMEFDQFRVFHDRAPLTPGEHCIQLAEGERIERIDVLAHERVNGVRVITNHRETPWFGRSIKGTAKSFVCGTSGRIFAGFHGTIGEKYVGSMGVVWAV